MIYVISGKPGDGKTQYAVSLLMNLIKKNNELEKKGEDVRPLYADIEGLTLDGVEPAPADWRDTPDGSIIFYDEVHYRKEYEDLTGKYSQNPMIKELSTHRHQNKDIYLITQDAKRLERSVRGLVDAMYYVKRPQNKPPFSTIYTFDKFYNEPSSAAAADKHHDSKMFKYKKEYFSAYKSASAHTSMSFKIQRKFIWAIAAIVVMITLSAKLMLSGGFIDIAKKGLVKADQQPQVEKVEKPVVYDTLTPEQRADLEARSPVATESVQNVNQVNYNPNKPFENQFDNAQVTNNQPYLSGCMQLKNSCSCFTQQGSKLHVSIADCKKIIDGDMPYNPFLTRSQPVVSSQSVSSAS